MKKYVSRLNGAVVLALLSVTTSLLIFAAFAIILRPFVNLMALGNTAALALFVIWSIVYMFAVIGVAAYCEAKPGAERKARKRR